MRRVTLLFLSLTLTLTCKDGAGPVVTDRVVVKGPAALYLGQSGQFAAAALDSHGDTLFSRPLAWSSSDTTVVTVSQSGLATTRAVGNATISAAADAKSGSSLLSVRLVPVIRVDVTPNNVDSLFVGDSLQLTATPRDSAGGALSRQLSWSTSDTAKATVSATGKVRTRAPGSFTVTATADGRSGGVFLYSQLRAVSLTMPDSLTVRLHQTVRLIPDLESGSGTHLSGRAMSWTSSDPAVLAVDQLGVLRPQTLGTATITARADTLADSSAVRVIAEPVTAIIISLVGAAPPVDTTLELFQALPFDNWGVSPLRDSIVWTSSDTTVMTVAASPTDAGRARATGHRPGTVRITATSGDLSGVLDYTLTYPMVRLIAQPDSLMLNVGETRFLGVFGQDRFGNRLTPSLWEMTSDDPTIAQVIVTNPRSIAGNRSGSTNIVVALSDALADTVPVTVSPTSAPRLHWSENVLPFQQPYSQIHLQLVSADSTGQYSMTPRDVRISSTDTSVVLPIDSVITGLVISDSIAVQVRRPGIATLIAAGDSQFVSLVVQVTEIPASTLVLDPTPTSGLRIGQSLQLHGTVRGIDGLVRSYPITWASLDESRAAVSPAGVISALATGDVAIVASSGSARDTAMFTILSTASPLVANISPAPLVPGAVVTIRGSGYDPDPTANSVLIDSVAATVTGASDSVLTLLLPPATAWPCTATHNARLLIRSGGQLGMDSVSFSVAAQRSSLAPGESLVLSGPAGACNELLPAGGDAAYVLTVANSDPATPIAFYFRSDGAGTSAPGLVPDQARALPATGTPVFPLALDSLRRAATFHRRLLEQSRALAQRAGPPAPLLRAARLQMPLRTPTATINGVARVRIPRLEDPDFCSSYRSIDANVAYIGTHVVILADRASPLANVLSGYYQALGAEFDNVMYPKLLANFGDPLAMDSLLDHDGRIAMVFSPLVNQYGVSGFVVSCDFYPESVAPSSNTAEVFYAQVPTVAGSGYSSYTPDAWKWLIRSVIMHESKHLTALAERLSRGVPPEETWLEESSAVLAEEIWSRSVYSTTWKGDASYRSTLYCDVRPAFPECAGRPYSMFNAFAFLYDYVSHLESRTPLGPSAPDDATFYGSGWSFLRWVIDQYATSESAFLRDMTREPTKTGVANLSARAQRPFNEMLSDWSDALYFDSWALAQANPHWSIPSWNVADIFAGMQADFPSDFPDSRPLRGRAWPLGSSFSLGPTKLQPGGWALFVANGSNLTSQLLDIHSVGNAPPPAALRIQLVRVR